MLEKDYFKKIQWDCIHFVDSCSTIEKQDSENFKIIEIDVSNVHSKEDLLQNIAFAMNFPTYFGHNWDALYECLNDLEWLPSDGYSLILKNSGNLWKRHTGITGVLVGIWLGSAENWAKENKSFHLVFELS